PWYLLAEDESTPARAVCLGRQVGKDPCISIGSKVGDVDSILHRSLLKRDSDYRLCALLGAGRGLSIVSCALCQPRKDGDLIHVVTLEARNQRRPALKKKGISPYRLRSFTPMGVGIFLAGADGLSSG